MTDLPASNEFSCILVIIDQFSEGCHLIPLKGLPTAMKTTELLFIHVFWNFGLPKDIDSDRGPQFISRVWKAFFSLLGVTVSFSSSPGKWANREENPGIYPLNFLQQPLDLLVPGMGRVRPEFTPPT